MSYLREHLIYRLVSTDLSNKILKDYVEFIDALVRNEQHDADLLSGVDTTYLSEMWRLPALPQLTEASGMLALKFPRRLVADYCFELVIECFRLFIESRYESPYQNMLKRAIAARKPYSEPSAVKQAREHRDKEDIEKVFNVLVDYLRQCVDHVSEILDLTTSTEFDAKKINSLRKLKLYYFKVDQSGQLVEVNVAFDKRKLTSAFFQKKSIRFKEKYARKNSPSVTGSARDMLVRNHIMLAAIEYVVIVNQLDIRPYDVLDRCLNTWLFDRYRYVDRVGQE